jgi:glycosyltransferase involved in cell wall biosynthesis
VTEQAPAAGGRVETLSGRDIVCVGFNDWDTELWTNQHHLMARLAANNNNILFIESLGLRRPTFAGRDLRRLARRLRNGLAGPRLVELPSRRHGDGETSGSPAPDAARHAASAEAARRPASLHVLSPLVLPFHARPLARRVNRVLLGWLVRRAARKLGMRRPILWGYVPQADALRAPLDAALTIYHCVDDIAAHERIDSASFAAAERAFVAHADLVLASAPGLATRLRTLSDRVALLPNVADTELFAGALADGPVDAALAALPAPRLLFTGAIAAAKLDFRLLVELARARRDWSIALIGPVGLGDPHTDVSALAAEPNVHLLGARRYEQLPAALRGADVGLIPYARNPLTDSVFPMKVYEYLSAGLPVLATPLPALEGIQEIEFAADADAAVEAVRRMLANNSRAARQARSAQAHGHSWDTRLREISELIAGVESNR